MIDDPSVTLDLLLGPDDLARALREDVARGLSVTPKDLPPKWFYDDRGCELFDAITRLPEYYPTERERTILEHEAVGIAELTDADTVIELGSGTSDKTRVLLDAVHAAGTLDRFVAFDVNEATVRVAADSLVARYAGLQVHAVVGDFERSLPTLAIELMRDLKLGNLAVTMASSPRLIASRGKLFGSAIAPNSRTTPRRSF